MKFDIARNFTELLSQITKETKGSFFINIEDKSAVGGVIVRGLTYNKDKVFDLIAKWKSNHKTDLNHLMIESNIILIQFNA